MDGSNYSPISSAKIAAPTIVSTAMLSFSFAPADDSLTDGSPPSRNAPSTPSQLKNL